MAATIILFYGMPDCALSYERPPRKQPENYLQSEEQASRQVSKKLAASGKFKGLPSTILWNSTMACDNANHGSMDYLRLIICFPSVRTHSMMDCSVRNASQEVYSFCVQGETKEE